MKVKTQLIGWSIAVAVSLAASGYAAAQDAIDGFRSAQFGMTKGQVLKAIGTDFRIERKKIGEARNLVEKTTLLAVRVEDMIPDAGSASVVYTLGFKSSQLIQITIQFGRPADKKVTPKALWATARVLQQALLAKGIDKSRVLVNKATSNRNTVVLYRGIDKNGRMALLTAVFAAGKNSTKAPKKNASAGIDIDRLRSVRLQYIRDPKEPDVYKPKKGDF